MGAVSPRECTRESCCPWGTHTECLFLGATVGPTIKGAAARMVCPPCPGCKGSGSCRGSTRPWALREAPPVLSDRSWEAM